MMTVITGGSGSGKSAYAEQLVLDSKEETRIYIATMYPFDEESRRRIARHRSMRAEKNFTTLECYTGIKHLQVPRRACVLLECMSNLVANEMFQEKGAKEQTVQEILAGLQNLRQQAGHLIVVTNEIFSDGITYDPETLRYQAYLGEINQKMAALADQVIEVVYGIPLFYSKGRQISDAGDIRSRVCEAKADERGEHL